MSQPPQGPEHPNGVNPQSTWESQSWDKQPTQGKQSPEGDAPAHDDATEEDSEADESAAGAPLVDAPDGSEAGVPNHQPPPVSQESGGAQPSHTAHPPIGGDVPGSGYGPYPDPPPHGGEPPHAGPPPYGQPYVGPPTTPGEERGWGVGTHLGGLMVSILVPLIVWLVYRERSRFLDQHGKEALNWQITVVIAVLSSGVFIFCIFIISWVVPFLVFLVPLSFLLIGSVMVIDIIFCIMASVAAYNLREFRYPVSIRLIK